MAVANPNKGTGADNANVRISGVQSGISSLPRKVVRGIGEGLGSLASSIAKSQKENARRIVDLDQNAASADAQTFMHKAMIGAQDRQDIGFLQNTDKWASQTRQGIMEALIEKYNANGDDPRSVRIRTAIQNKLNSYDAQIMKMHNNNAITAGEQLTNAKAGQIISTTVQNINGNDDDIEVAQESFEQIGTLRAHSRKQTYEDQKAIAKEVFLGIADKGSDQGMANAGKNILAGVTQAVNNINPKGGLNKLITVTGEPIDKFIKAQLEINRRADKARLRKIFENNQGYLDPEILRQGMTAIDKKYKEAETRMLGAADAEISKVKNRITSTLKDIESELKFYTRPWNKFKEGQDPNEPLKSFMHYLDWSVKGNAVYRDPLKTGGQMIKDGVGAATALKNGDFGAATTETMKFFAGAFKLVQDAGRIVFANPVADRWLKHYFTKEQRDEIVNTDALNSNQVQAMNEALSIRSSRAKWNAATDQQKEAYRLWFRIKNALYEKEDINGNKTYHYRYFHQAVRANPKYSRTYKKMIRDRIKDLDPNSVSDFISEDKQNSSDLLESTIALAESNGEWGNAAQNAFVSFRLGAMNYEDYMKFKSHLKTSTGVVPPQYQETYDTNMKGIEKQIGSLLAQDGKLSSIIGVVYENHPKYQEIMYWLRKEFKGIAKKLDEQNKLGKSTKTTINLQYEFDKRVAQINQTRKITVKVNRWRNGKLIEETKTYDINSIIGKKDSGSGGSKDAVKKKIDKQSGSGTTSTRGLASVESTTQTTPLKDLPYIKGVPAVRLNEEYIRLTNKSTKKPLTVFEEIRRQNIGKYLIGKVIENDRRKNATSAE